MSALTISTGQAFNYDTLSSQIKNIMLVEDIDKVAEVFHNRMPKIDWKTFELLDITWDTIFPECLPVEIIFVILRKMNMYDMRNLFPKLYMNLQYKMLTLGSQETEPTRPTQFLHNTYLLSSCSKDKDLCNMRMCAFFETIPKNVNKMDYINTHYPVGTGIEHKKINPEFKNKITEYLGDYEDFKEFLDKPIISGRIYGAFYGHKNWITAYRKSYDSERVRDKLSAKDKYARNGWTETWDLNKFDIVEFLNWNGKYKISKKEYNEFCVENEIRYEDKRGNCKGYKYPKSFTLKQYSNWIKNNL